MKYMRIRLGAYDDVWDLKRYNTLKYIRYMKKSMDVGTYTINTFVIHLKTNAGKIRWMNVFNTTVTRMQY